MSAVVLSGAVIKNDNGHSVFTSSFVCPKCKKRQEIRIQH
jgi:hypothetical protein